jgi:glycosyltransferase involved in cell wall biosynthesis
MNILEVVEACGAGVGRHVAGLCEGLVDRGHRVTVAYSPRRLDEAFRQFMVDQQDRIYYAPLEIGREVAPVSDLRGVRQLRRLIKRRGPFDIVHGHSSKGGAIARIAGRWSGIPTVYTPNGLIMSSPTIPRAARASYTMVERVLGQWATSKIIAVSQDERDFIIKQNLVPKERVTLIGNGIDDGEFECFPDEHARSADIREKPLVFGSVMRFNSQKAPGHLLSAFVRLSAALPQVPMRLVVAGDGELFPKVQKQVEASRLGERVSLLGWRTDTRRVLRELDVFVLSSLYEGLPYNVIEAMAAKLPVVSTDVFGTEETVARVPGNVVVASGSPEALADGMKHMATLDYPESLRQSLRRIGQANHSYARVHFKQSRTTHRTIDTYRALSSST